MMSNQTIKVIVVDDEEPARKLIAKFLTENNNFEIIEQCSDGFSAVKKINELKPDLVFLDIQMPKLSGLEVLELLEESPMIVFITAFDEYAVKAFELNAIDYIMKPFSKKRFAETLEKVQRNISLNKNVKTDVQKIKKIAEKDKIIDRIAVSNRSNIEVLPVDSISLFEAMDDYVQIYSKKGKFLKNTTMKYLEEHLDNNMFLRIHRSFIVNLNCIERIERAEKNNFFIILKNKAVAKASKTRIKELRKRLQM